MKNLFVVLFCSFLVMSGYAFADELSYEIDPVATANAKWKMGEIIIEKGDCGATKYYRKFLGVTQSNLVLAQDFYFSGKKFTNPFLISIKNANKNDDKNDDKNTERCRYPSGIEGNFTRWHENGQKWAESFFKNGELEGIFTWWYENGQKKMESSNKNDKKDGVARIWHENGQKFIEGNFKNDKKIGIWRAWDENGNLIEEKDYGTPTD